jgi:hypothetical protein
MEPTCRRRLAITLVAVVSACGNPAGPGDTGYAGQWSGTTAQGRPIDFTISPAEAVTAITVGHAFNGCSGSQTFSNLSLDIAPQVQCIPGPCAPSISSFRSFGYVAGDRVLGPSTSINAVFESPARAQGTVNFRGLAGCGDAIGVAWSAVKR